MGGRKRAKKKDVKGSSRSATRGNSSTRQRPGQALVWCALGVAALALVAVLSLVKPRVDDKSSRKATAHSTGPSELDHLTHTSKLILAGNIETAITETERAVQQYPESAQLALRLADAYATDKDYAAALLAYQQAASMLQDDKPSLAKALTWVGVCHRRLSDRSDSTSTTKVAYEWMHRAIAEGEPGHESYYHLGSAYRKDNRYAEAARMWVNVLQAPSASTKDVRHLADIISAVGHWELLRDLLQSCLEGLCSDTSVYPEYWIHLQLSAAYLELDGGGGESYESLNRASRLANKSVERIIVERGSYLKSIGDIRSHIIDLPPDKMALHKLYDELTDAYKPLFAKQMRPVADWKIIQKKHIEGFRWPIPHELIQKAQQSLEQQKRAFAQDPSSVKDVVPPLACQILPIFSLEDCFFSSRVSTVKRRQLIEKSSNLQIMDYDDFKQSEYPSTDDPLHIGIFSADIRGHPMLALLTAFLKHSSRMSGVTVTVYHASADPPILERLSDFADNKVACRKESFHQCVEHARKNKVQVWLETTGTTGEGIPSIFTAGPAPVGVLWAGFPGSVAANETIQYIVSDTYTVPVELGIPAGSFVYSYFGRLWKVDDRIFDAWAHIIRNVPDSYLILVHIVSDASINQQELLGNFRTRWKANGMPADRLLIIPPFRRGEHLQIMKQLCDAALDTIIYGGGTTAYDALYAGLPMVHFSLGMKMMQRAGGSILAASGLGDILIAKSLENYVDIGTRLGKDREFYGMVKRRLQAASEPSARDVLFRPQVAVEALVEGLREAYRLWKMEKPPDTIHSSYDIPEESHPDAVQLSGEL